MTQYLMSNYLSIGSSDYDYTLVITPDRDMPIIPIKTQKILYTDDNDPLVININDNLKYKIKLLWEVLSFEEAMVIMDLFSDTEKANGFLNSFKWYNPIDTKIYVVKFISTPILKCFGAANHQGLDEVELLVINKTNLVYDEDWGDSYTQPWGDGYTTPWE